MFVSLKKKKESVAFGSLGLSGLLWYSSGVEVLFSFLLLAIKHVAVVFRVSERLSPLQAKEKEVCKGSNPHAPKEVFIRKKQTKPNKIFSEIWLGTLPLRSQGLDVGHMTKLGRGRVGRGIFLTRRTLTLDIIEILIVKEEEKLDTGHVTISVCAGSTCLIVHILLRCCLNAWWCLRCNVGVYLPMCLLARTLVHVTCSSGLSLFLKLEFYKHFPPLMVEEGGEKFIYFFFFFFSCLVFLHSPPPPAKKTIRQHAAQDFLDK